MSSGSSDRGRPPVLRAALLGILLSAAAGPAAVFAKGISVSPAHLFADVKAGDEWSQTIAVSPADATRTRVSVSVDAFVLDADGNPQRGSRSGATADLAVETREVVLDGGRRESVTVRCRVPETAAGTLWAVVLFEAEPVERPGAGDKPVLVVTRLAVPVFLTVSGTERRDLRILGLDVVSATAGRVDVSARVRNEGNAVLRPTGLWTVEEAPGGAEPVELATADVEPAVILPGSTRVLHASLASKDRDKDSFAAASAPGGDRRRITAGLYLRFGTGSGDVRQAHAPVALGAAPVEQ
jgi:hypothetical protein